MARKFSRRTFLKLSVSVIAGLPLVEEISTIEQVIAARDIPLHANTSPAVSAQTWPKTNVPRELTLNLMQGVHPIGINNPYASGYTHQHGGASQLEGLFYYAALNDKMYPWLAESYSYNNDATELTVTIKQGIKWSDGEDFTAHDVAFTYNMLKQFAPYLRDSSSVSNAIQNAEVIDDHTVKFHLLESDYRFHFTHCTYRFDRGVYLVPEHIYNQFTTYDQVQSYTGWDPDNGLYGTYTGAYLLAATEENYCSFHRRDDWWAVSTGFISSLPVPEVINNIPYPSDELATQLLINDEVDTTIDMSPATLEAILAQSDHITTHTGTSQPYGYVDWWPISMFFNTLEEPYDDPDVRWAVAYAINQQAAVNTAFGGAGIATGIPFPEYPRLMSFVDGAQTVLAPYPVTEQDLSEVETLMTGAGFTKDGEGFWVKDSVRPDADLYAPVPLFTDIATAIVAQLRQAGFDAVHVSPPDVWTAISDGRALLHLFGHGGSVWDPYQTLQMYHSKWAKPTGENCGENRPRWSNTEYDGYIDTMALTNPDDTTTIQTLFNQAMEIWYRELPEVPIIQWMHRVPMNTTYWRNWPTSDNPYNTAHWHLTFPITLCRIQQQLPENTVAFTTNYNYGAPGSVFTLLASGFPANSPATLTINGIAMPDSLSTYADGNLRIVLNTDLASSGAYVIEITVNPSAKLSIQIADGAPLRIQEDSGTEVVVPADIALANTIFLPSVENQ